jgi:hypothetical protein
VLRLGLVDAAAAEAAQAAHPHEPQDPLGERDVLADLRQADAGASDPGGPSGVNVRRALRACKQRPAAAAATGQPLTRSKSWLTASIWRPWSCSTASVLPCISTVCSMACGGGRVGGRAGRI